jgi:gamma-aminobutyrate permease
MKTQTSTSSPPALQRALTTRQLTMIALGGVIGAGLFVGSGKAIGAVGPGVVLVYLGAGVVIILVMRMLAELAVASPETGSFAAYATRELGPWAGLAVGWLYAYHWCVVVAFEAIAGAAIAVREAPRVPSWLAALVFMALLTAVNLTRVRSFGRFEFWFALIKVSAIVVFIVLGALAVLGVLPGISPPGLTNLTGLGGLFPKGPAPILTALLVVFFSYFGTEVVTLAAGEARDPSYAVRRAMRSVAWRVLVFYGGSILIVVTLLPWNATRVTASPYTAVLAHLGIPGAAVVMDLIVLTAVLSCLNSGIYSSSRMLYAMSRLGQAPPMLSLTNRSGVPVFAVLAASAAGFLAVVANYFLPTAVVFSFLLDSSAAVAVVVYLCIAATQIAGRRRRDRERARLTVRMWGFPYLSGFVVVALLTVIGAMAWTPASRQPLALTLVVTTIAVTAGLLWQRRRRRAAPLPAPPRPGRPLERAEGGD